MPDKFVRRKNQTTRPEKEKEMKTKLNLDKSGVLKWKVGHAGKLLGSLLAAAIFLAFSLINPSFAGSGKGESSTTSNICLKTAADALAACNATAQSDYKTAQGKCINITDRTARRDCEKQAAADL